ncbi:hypothetical protein D1007_10445 [Hordeum vulgare]|uniref:Uncharacterized protein n=1 Tax=Hordeum vulgare subsp. vulgare TaxID=112509 RepID=A0A8I6W781_HORVV|nr:hypothetical protein D1007_10445 [Hordeum vulgare]
MILLAYKCAFHLSCPLHTRHTHTHKREKARSNTERRAMEHSYSNSGVGISNYGSSKERRPPLKRGQLKRQIVRTISNLMAPRNDGAGADKRASARTSFGTYN